jgi:segregation and condensation protein B
LRLIEALLFAAGEPLDEKTLRSRLPEGVDIASAMRRLQAEYASRGVNLVRVAGKWTFRTANDLGLAARARFGRAQEALARRQRDARDHRLSPAGDARRDRGHPRLSPVSKGTVDVLMETGWIRPRGRRKAPGRRSPSAPRRRSSSISARVDRRSARPRRAEGHRPARWPLPAGFSVPLPSDDAGLREDEDPLEPGDLDLGLAPRAEPEE